LLLDEPTNHLDLPAIEWLEAELEAARSALVIVSHDRRFLQNLSRNTVWLDRGRTRFLARGFLEFESWRDRAHEDDARARHKLDRKTAGEEHWLRYGGTARRKRNQKRLEDLAAMRAARRQRGEELRALKARLQSLLDDTGFYARNSAKFAEVSAAFAKAEAALDQAEGEWLRLEILREEIGR
jgi:ATP-binding cassette subfamily F protein uup